VLIGIRNLIFLVVASLWRAVHPHTTRIVVTCSVGKTTARTCLAAILATQGPTAATFPNANAAYSVYKALLRIRRRHRYAVIEIGIDAPGQMGRWAGAVSPHMAVILTPRLAHPQGLPTLDVVAREKGRAVAALRRGGTAVLNGEDPRVRAMAAVARGRAVFYGDCADSVARARDVRTSIAEGLRFVVHTPAGSAEIRMNLFGTHWLPSVLSAVAAAHTLGVPLESIVEALGTVQTQTSRMQVVPLPNGAMLIRDERNGSLPTFQAAVAFMRTLAAPRRFLILTEVRDLDEDPATRFRYLAGETLGAFEGAILVGPHAETAAACFRDTGMESANVFAFAHTKDASEKLMSIVGNGDVALLRGRGRIDKLMRIPYAQFGTVECWLDVCTRIAGCDTCPQLGARTPQGERTVLPLVTPYGTTRAPRSARAQAPGM